MVDRSVVTGHISLVIQTKEAALNRYDPAQFRNLAETKTGRALWKFLNRDDNVVRMETASDLRRPAVEPLGKLLLDTFGPEVRGNRWKQMIGHMARQVLERSGFQLDVQGMKVRGSPLFNRASRYSRRRQ